MWFRGSSISNNGIIKFIASSSSSSSYYCATRPTRTITAAAAAAARATTSRQRVALVPVSSSSSPLLLSSSSSSSKRVFGTSPPFHIDSPDNKVTTKFDFTESNYKLVDKIVSKYPSNYKQSAIIPLLDLAQRQSGGWLPVAAMDKVAQVVEVEPSRVYEVASFYTMFNRQKVGKYFIQLCGTTPCMICGAQDIKQTIENHLGIKKTGQSTTPDGLFTLLEVECLGACANAPMIQLNDDYYECLTPETTIQLLEACKKGNPPPMGKWGSLPMNGQVSCEGPLGKTTLFAKPKPVPIREGGFNGEVDPASVKKHMAY